ncbi:hypothetical protein H4582DRAFT_910849 [Lactarius indigo]|nr:hypothetical protein H4582DRAFT_910849 [Lactarius indigo]
MSSKRSRRHALPSPTPAPQQKHAKYKHHDVPTDPRQQWRDLLSLSLQLASKGENPLEVIHRYVANHISLHEKEEFGSRTPTSADQFKTIVRFQQPQFLELVSKVAGSGATGDDWDALFRHDAFWVATSRPAAIDERIASKESQGQAVERSWTANFVGKGPLRALKKHVKEQMTRGKAYARYCSIVQSSGMGKSRLLDEFSKEHFLIPINLRPKDGEGFPPADDEVRDFLTSSRVYKNNNMGESSYMRACYFLEALFCIAAETITKIDAHYTPSEGNTKRTYRIKRFREIMSEGQIMGSSGLRRVEFYHDVVNRAERDILSDERKQGNKSKSRDKSKPDNEHDKDLIAAVEELQNRVKDGSPSAEELLPDVFIVFDEAHLLTVPFKHEGVQSHFVELCRALRILSDMSLFTFFLSTTGKISQFSPPRGRDASNRMNDGELITPKPFIYLGFDHLMKNHKIFDKYKTLKDVTSLDCIAHMGRPLWGTIYDHGDDEVRRGHAPFCRSGWLWISIARSTPHYLVTRWKKNKSRYLTTCVSACRLEMGSKLYAALPRLSLSLRRRQPLL